MFRNRDTKSRLRKNQKHLEKEDGTEEKTRDCTNGGNISLQNLI